MKLIIEIPDNTEAMYISIIEPNRKTDAVCLTKEDLLKLKIKDKKEVERCLN